MTHFSSSNTGDKKLFENTNGEAIKVRDRSNSNNIFGNTFKATGGVSAYLDDFCDQQCVNGSQTKKYGERASYGNRFADNTVVTGPVWDLIPPGQAYAGGPGCSIPAGKVRLTAAGNK